MTLQEFNEINWHRGNVVKFLLWQAAKPSGGYECDNYNGRGLTFPSVAELFDLLRTDCSPPTNGGVGGGDSMVVCLHCHTVQPLTVGGMIAEVLALASVTSAERLQVSRQNTEDFALSV